MNIETLFRAARAAEAAGQMRTAVDLCQQVLSLDPNCVDALLMLGSLCARHGRVAEAEGFLRKAATADPNSYDAVRWLTTLLIGRDGGRDAVQFGQRAVQLRPTEAESHVVLGLAAMGAGDSELTITSFQRAIEINQQMSGAYHNLGVALQREESFDEAIEALRRATELSPTVTETYLHLGRCYLAEELFDEALACGHRVLELNPNSNSAKHLLSDANYAAVHGENGLHYINAAMARNPDAPFPHALLGSCLQEQGDFAEAEVSLLRSIELQPIQGFAYYVLAHNRKMRDADLPAFQRIEAVSKQADLVIEDRQYIHFALGKAYDDIGDYEKAMVNFDLAHEQPGKSATDAQGSHPPRHTSRIRGLSQLFTPEVLERFSDLGLESEEPIFIFGMPRSGTTLLEQIVSRHSTVAAGGELFFWRDNCRRIVNLSKGALNPKELVIAGQKYLELLRSIGHGKAHVTDKFPSNYVYLGLLDLIYPKARFIHARRNPLDTCLSIYMRPFSTNQGLGRTRREIVETYHLYRESIEHWRTTLAPGRFIDVDYEEVVQDTETMARKVIDYCGLEWEDACLRPQEGDRRVVTFSKWQVRQPVYTTSVERWRNYEPWLGIFRELVEEEHAGQ